MGHRAEPGAAATTAATTPTTGAGQQRRAEHDARGGRTADRSAVPDDAAAGRQQGQEFVLQRPFVPAAKANQLSSFMIARKDGENYGKLVSYEIPTTDVAPSPAQAGDARSSPIRRSARSSRCSTSAAPRCCAADASSSRSGTRSSTSRPIYVEGQGEGQFPRLAASSRVTYGEKAVLDSTSVTGTDDHDRALGGSRPSSRVEPRANRRRTPTTTPTQPTTTPSSPTADHDDRAAVDRERRASCSSRPRPSSTRPNSAPGRPATSGRTSSTSTEAKRRPRRGEPDATATTSTTAAGSTHVPGPVFGSGRDCSGLRGIVTIS